MEAIAIRNETFIRLIRSKGREATIEKIRVLLSDGIERTTEQIAQQIGESILFVRPRICEMRNGLYGNKNRLKVTRKGHYLNKDGLFISVGYYTLDKDLSGFEATLFNN